MVSVAQCVVLTALYTSCSLPEWHPCWHHIISSLSQFLCLYARLHLQSHSHEWARSTHITTMLTFWQTKSHAIIAHKTVPPDCIEGVISQKVETSLYQRHSTPRPPPRIILSVLGISNSKVIWEASRIWSGRGTKVITTVLRKLRDTTSRTVS